MFRNDVDDYIDHRGIRNADVADRRRSVLFCQFYQYQNIAQARIEGFEAETMYDAGTVVRRRLRHLMQAART